MSQPRWSGEAATCSKTFFAHLASKFLCLLCVLTLICTPPEISAKLVAVCASTSKITPNKVALWFFVDHRLEHMGGPPGGKVNVEDQNGYQTEHEFSMGCDFGTECTDDAEQGFDDYLDLLTSNCYNLTLSGQRVAPDDAKLTCYKHAKADDNPLDDIRSWGVGVTATNDKKFVNDGAKKVCSAFPIVLTGRVSGLFGVGLSDNDFVLDVPIAADAGDGSGPTDDTKADLGVLPLNQYTYWLELAVAGGGTDCTAKPSGGATSNTASSYADGKSYDSDFCANTPDGFVCPILCNAGFQKKSLLTCENGAWYDYFGCTSVSDLCQAPSATNNAGIAPEKGIPVSTYFTQPSAGDAGCNYWSMKNSICFFRCEQGTGYWGAGYLRCSAPPTWAAFGGTDCVGADVDQVWPAPLVLNPENVLQSVPLGAMRLTWENGYVNAATMGGRSEGHYYEFDILPAGTLHCETLRAHLPPKSGYVCSGSPHILDPNYIGTYEIKVRYVNGAGAGEWSTPLKLGCEPLLAPYESHWWSSRYDLSACQQVGSGQKCEVMCAGADVTDPNLVTEDFTCAHGAGGQPAGVLPVCIKKANPPAEVRATAISTSSLHVTWKDAGLNDCDADADDGVTFDSWVVSVAESGTETWQSTGCTGLTNPCIHKCTLTGLNANQAYKVKVQATCNNADANSEETLSFGTFTTWPQASSAPRLDKTLTVVGDNTLYLEWLPAESPGDCIFQRYEVWLQWPASDGIASIWEPDPLGCEHVTGLSCTIESLPCDSGFYYAVKSKCEDPHADSPPSDSHWTTTTEVEEEEDCLSLAEAPTGLGITAMSDTSLRLTWTAGNANDCIFLGWQVLLRRRINEFWEEWQQEEGCTALFDRSIVACTATNLRPGTEYKFRMLEQCTTKANSLWSFESSSARTYITLKDPQIDVKIGNVTDSTVDIKWRAALWHECDFEKWYVIISQRNPNTEIFDPVGCKKMYTKSVTTCTAAGLVPNTEYRANVMMKCRSAALWSRPSESSSFVKTIANQSAAPSFLSNQSVTSTKAELEWDSISGSMADCDPIMWMVQAKAYDAIDWGIPAGCSEVSMDETKCTATLRCNTEYLTRVAAWCSAFDVQGLWKYSKAYVEAVGSCSIAASQPLGLRLKSPEMRSIFITWTPGAPNDCSFDSWEIEMLQENTTSWVAAKGSCSASQLKMRAASCCTAEGMRSNTKYLFRVREVCSASSMNSFWTVSEVSATIAERLMAPASKTPEGVALSLPTSLLMTYPESVSIAMNKYTATFWATGCYNAVTSDTFASLSEDDDIWQEMQTICSAVEAGTATPEQKSTCCGTTALGCKPICEEQSSWQWLTICPEPQSNTIPNECGCDATNCTDGCISPNLNGTILELLGDRMLRYPFPGAETSSFRIIGGCNYKVRLPPNMVRTLAVPISFLPATEWYFNYNPPTELLSLNMAGRSTTGFDLSATLNHNANVECTVAGQSGWAQYQSPTPARVQITGLNPDAAHEATCTARLMDHPFSQACESVPRGALSPDDCVFFSDDGSVVNYAITASSTPAPSSGKFCRQISMVRGFFRTQPDVNNLLKSLTVGYVRKCPQDFVYGPPVPLRLTPSFDRTAAGATYSFSLDYSNYRKECNKMSGSIAVTYGIVVTAKRASESASLTWLSGADDQDESIFWPASGPDLTPTIVTRRFRITPGNGNYATYEISGKILYQTFEIKSVQASNPLDRHALRTDGQSTLSVLVWVDQSSLSTFNLANLKVFLGSFEQGTTTPAAVSPITVDPTDPDAPVPPGKKQFYLEVSQVKGMGVNLPVIIDNIGMKAIGKIMVSFAEPMIKKVAMKINNLAATAASFKEDTMIRVQGDNVAVYPAPDVPAVELRVYTVQAQWSVDWPPVGVFIWSSLCSGRQDVTGDYRMVKPYFPMNDPYEHALALVCDVSKPVYIGATACLCSDASDYKLWVSGDSPEECGSNICDPPGTDNPMNCLGPIDAVSINETIPVELNMTMSEDNEKFSGTYQLRLPGSPTLLSDSFFEAMGCNFSRPQWLNESSAVTARLCWSQDAWRMYSKAGSVATDLEASLNCGDGYEKDATKCVPATGIVNISHSKRLSPTSFSATGGLTNLCTNPSTMGSSEIRCVLPATLEHPLVAQVWARTGNGDTWVVVAENDNLIELEQFWVQKPKMTSISQLNHKVDGTGSFDVTGTNFPLDSVAGLLLQLWGTWVSVPPYLPVDTTMYWPLCGSLVTTSETEATCTRGDTWNGSVLGSWSPNLFMQIAPNVFSLYPLENQMTVEPTNVTSIIGSDNLEVGPLEFTLTGSFGDEGAGDLEILFHYNDTFDVTTYIAALNDSAAANASEPNADVGERRLQESDADDGADDHVPLLNAEGQEMDDPCDLGETRRRRRRRRAKCEEDNKDKPKNYRGKKTACITTTRTATSVTCQVNGSASIFGDPLPEIDYTHVEDPPREYIIAGTVRYAGMGNANGTRFEFKAAFFTCEPGYYRKSRETRECEKCQKGRHKSIVNAFLQCDLCPLGRYADQEGQPECIKCAGGQSTPDVGMEGKAACLCKEGFYRVKNQEGCQPCPPGAYCRGDYDIPVALPGYWSSNGIDYYQCYPLSACLHGSNESYNICGEGRAVDKQRKFNGKNVRCVECKASHYRYRSECFECTYFDRMISLIAPAAVAVMLKTLIILTLSSHRRRKSVVAPIPETRRKAKVTRWERIKKYSKTHGPNACFQYFFPPRVWPRLIREMAGTSPVRMFALALGRLQLLWAMGLMPVEWSFPMKAQQQMLSVFTFDLEVMRFGCLLSTSGQEATVGALLSGFTTSPQGDLYVVLQLLQFFSPYLIVGILWLAIKIATCFITDPTSPRYVCRKGALMSCMAFQGFVMAVRHFADDFWFLACVECEGDKQCSKGFPLIKCSADELGWKFMVFLAGADLIFIVLPAMSVLFEGIFKSWCWQHGAGSGLDSLGNTMWYLELAEFWVKHYKGYSKELREEVEALRGAMREAKENDISLNRLWDRAVHMVKVNRWKATEKDVENKIFGMCADTEKERAMADARALNPKTTSARRNLMSKMRLKRAEKKSRQKKQEDVTALDRCLCDTMEFIRETEFGSGISYESLFWMYSWEYVLLIQKMLIVLLSMSASPKNAQETLAACLFFQLLVMVGEVDLEPHEWNFLNEIELAMDVLTVYTIIFVQLDWQIWQAIMTYTINLVTIGPVILKFFFVPPLKDDQELDKSGHIVQKQEVKVSIVDMAIYQEVLGPGGMQRLIRLQRRTKRHLRKRRKEDPLYVPPLAKDRRPVNHHHDNDAHNQFVEPTENEDMDEEKDKSNEEVPPPAPIDKKALMHKLETCDKLLKAPVESVLKFGWEGIKWPSDFTAVHLAANQGCCQSIQILYECKADVDKQDEWGRTPLDYAKQHDRKDAISELEKLLGQEKHHKEYTKALDDEAAKTNDAGETVYGNSEPGQEAKAGKERKAAVDAGEGPAQARPKKRAPRPRAMTEDPSSNVTSPETSPSKRGQLRSRGRDKARTSLGEDPGALPVSPLSRPRARTSLGEDPSPVSVSPSSRPRPRSKSSARKANAPAEVVMF